MTEMPQLLKASLMAEGFNELVENSIYEMKGWRVVWEKGRLYVPFNMPIYYIYNIVKEFEQYVVFAKIFIVPGIDIFAIEPDKCSADSIEHVLIQAGFRIIDRVDNESGTWFECTWLDNPFVMFYDEGKDKLVCVTEKLTAEEYETLTSIFPDIIMTSPQTIFGFDFGGTEYVTYH